jgi:hypothetical protein
MSLYDKSSLLQVPSLYKDGTLVSTIPEDRSGDFTVSRGSNLAATRIGPDGYIKKGYENLLLQSNTFDTNWLKTNVSVSGGQSGYDGSLDAWLIEKSASNGRIQQSGFGTLSGVYTISIYAKKNESQWMRILGNASTNGDVFIDLENGVFGAASNVFDTNIESVGNGWYRCSFSANYSGLFEIRIFPAEENSTSGTSGSVYIQDAQLNQGLVAYPYLETTTAPAQGGLLENTPRLDWSNGVPSVLAEEGRTNLVPSSEYLSSIPWNSNSLTFNWETSIINLEGYYGTQEIIGIGNAVYNNMASGVNIGDKLCYSIWAKSSSSEDFKFGGLYGGEHATFNISTGTLVAQGSRLDSYEVIDYGNGWRRYIIVISYSGAGGNKAYGHIEWNDASEAVYLWGFQLEQDATTPSSYIPTYGTTQTRSKEVISDNFNIPTTATIYNSFYSDVAEQVYVLDQVFNVSVGLNKVAIAFSPTAIKISVGGSITANATGTYDTTSLSNIQLGSNNGTDYSNAPISGFYVFPEFLTDAELNSLTD